MEKVFQNVEEILADERFQAWYLKTGDDKSMEWEQWMKENALQQALVNEAVLCMEHILITEKPVSAQQVEAAHETLMAKLPKSESGKIASLSPARKWWWAAAVLILVSAGAYWWFAADNRSSITTQYGQLQHQKLPDGTEVTLNANSSIAYTSGWDKGKEREVWIKGEAYFHVKKTPAKSRFIVHTDQLDVIVTGTQFNVMNRNNVTNVMLTEGRVILITKDGKEISMLPGDFIELNNNHLEKKPVKEEAVLAWKERKLVFENTPLREALKKIREHYDVVIKLGDESIGDKQITGMMPNDNLDVLLQALEATLEFKIIHNSDEIIITNP